MGELAPVSPGENTGLAQAREIATALATGILAGVKQSLISGLMAGANVETNLGDLHLQIGPVPITLTLPAISIKLAGAPATKDKQENE